MDDDTPLLVLDLKESQAGETHGISGVVEHVRAVLAAQHHRPKAVITAERPFERRQARGDAVVLARDVGAHDVDECGDPALVFACDPPRHRIPDTQTKNEQRDQHHHPEGHEEAGAETHGARWTVPS